MIVKIPQLGKTQPHPLHAADLPGNFHHVTDLERVGENQRQPGNHILHEPLRTEADREPDHRSRRQISGDELLGVHPEHVQDETQTDGINDQGQRAGNQAGERDEFGLVRDKADRRFFGGAFPNEPVADELQQANEKMRENGETNDDGDLNRDVTRVFRVTLVKFSREQSLLIHILSRSERMPRL